MATVTGRKKKNRSLESLKKRKNVVQKEHVVACSKLEISFNECDDDLDRLWKEFTNINENLNELCSEYLEAAAETLKEDELRLEYEAWRRYQSNFFKWQVKMEKRTSQPSSSDKENKNIHRLPRLEIRQFDGEPYNWLPFWFQFKRIHEDVNVSNADKLQYLYQFTTGKVRKLVEGYPQIEENYEKILKHIVERYANNKLLVRYYVKEIIKLVIDSKNRCSVEKLYQALEINVRALETLGVTKDKYCNILLPLVEAALPENLLMLWHRQSSSEEFKGDRKSDEGDELASLLNFLGKEVESRSKVQEAGFSFVDKRVTQRTQPNIVKGGTAAALVSVSDSQSKCVFCEKPNHPSIKCFMAKKLNLNERKKFVFKNGACFCCLKIGHKASQCQVQSKCTVCSKRHADLLCEQAEKKKEATLACMFSMKGKSSYLPTVLVNIVNGQKVQTVRALIDSGCQRSYILESLTRDMRLKPVGQEVLANCLFGGVVSKQRRYNLYDIVLTDIGGKCNLEVSVLGEDVLCNFVPGVEGAVANKFPELTFSDLTQNLPVSLVLGADVFGQVFSKSSTVSRGELTAMKSLFGWVLCGPRQSKNCNSMTTTCLKNVILPSLWELDVLGIQDQLEVKKRETLDEETMMFFEKRVSRNENGRYSVALPWLSDHPILPDNREMAEGRLRSMTARLCRNNLVDSYQSVFDEWEGLDIIEVVPEKELKRSCHYLAHRPVIRMMKETTKVRPVFDASYAKENCPSLNDCLSKGPNLLKMIIPLLIRFRLHKYGLIADIEKAFLQIELNEPDRDFLRFLWWRKGKIKRELLVYRHKRVVFGVCCSPFLLNATIAHHLAKYNKADERVQNIVKKLASSLYVDDCVVSVENMDELNEFMNVSERVMRDACFNLRGWKYNKFQETDNDCVHEALVLGLKWNLEMDSLSCAFQFDQDFFQQPFTKRRLLSLANKIFDPLGFLSPVSLVPKLLLQQTWKLKLRWDEELPADISENIRIWSKHLSCLHECKIPRWLFSQPVNWERCSLHVFCDASNVAYAACVFMRAEEDSGVRVQLLLAKSRVSPLKDVTIPRLELLSAIVAVRLVVSVQNSLPVKLKTTYWTDSKVVLAWIKRNDPWNVFVRNRVKEIHDSSEVDDWRHVPGRLNPADLPSRGCNALKLLGNSWWNGPEWLSLRPEEWPKEEEGDVDEDAVLIERKRGVCLISVVSQGFLMEFERYFSSFSRIVRMCAWMFRFSCKLKCLVRLKNAKHDTERSQILQNLENLKGELSLNEITSAEIGLLKLIQSECLCLDDFKMFKGLKLFKDDKGLIRVESRLTQGLDDDYFQNPIVLIDHELVRRLIREEHIRLGHAGVLITLSQLREKFFIIKGRQLVKKTVKSCVVCRKVLAKPFVIPEAPLPIERTGRVAAFQISGVDLGGPLFVRKGKKVWFAIFTCAVYRAVHIEVVENLSSEAFILALRRFLARRGRVSTFFSDRGTNFVGTNNLLARLNWDVLQKECNLRRIEWRFNPPAAPWWGGWWERLIGVVKIALRKTLGRAYLSFIELETVLCDIEATINSRPLTYLSEDPGDLRAITPAHFIQDFPGSGTADLDKIDRKFLGKRVKYVNEIRTHLRERFRKEYLGDLINRHHKEKKVLTKVKVGDVVLVEDHQSKRVTWPLGRVVELMPGRDGNCRVAKVRLESGHLIRPVQRLYPLEIETGATEIISDEHVKTRSGRVVRPVRRLNL